MAYGFYSQITVDKTKVGETDANFAVLVSGTYDGTGGEPDIRTTANGGNVQNTASGGASGSLTVPADLVFSTDTVGTNVLDFEIEKYDPATGEIVAWVQCGVDTAADTVFYMVYGDSGVTTSQENVTGTWDANFKGVWHLGEASGGEYDSTINNNDLADNNTVGSASGVVGNARDFERGNSEFLNITDAAQAGLDPSGDFTIEAWVKVESVSTRPGFIVAKDDDTSRGYALFHQKDGNFAFMVFESDVSYTIINGAIVSTLTDYHFVAVYDYVGSGTSAMTLYRDASVDASSTTAVGPQKDTTAYFSIGAREYTGSPDYFDGLIDEVRISSVARSANWISTCYNNQSSPSTFYSVGAEQEANLAPTAPTSLLCEGQTNPLNITDTTPEFSAIYNDPDAGDIANKYRIQVDDNSDFSSPIWDSGAAGTAMANVTEGNRCADITYAGPALARGTKYYWRIKFWDDSGSEGAWSTE